MSEYAELEVVKKMMKNYRFDEIETNFASTLVDGPNANILFLSMATLRFSRSLAKYTMWLTIATAILSTTGIMQIFILFFK